MLYRNLVDAALVTTTFEVGGEIFVHNFTGHLLIDETTGHDKHIGIIVLTDEMGNLGNPAQTGTDALVLVERHTDAFAAATDSNAGKYLAILDAACQGMTEFADR